MITLRSLGARHQLAIMEEGMEFHWLMAAGIRALSCMKWLTVLDFTMSKAGLIGIITSSFIGKTFQNVRICFSRSWISW